MPATEAPKAQGLESTGLLDSLKELTKEIIPTAAASAAPKKKSEPAEPAAAAPGETPPKPEGDGTLPDLEPGDAAVKPDATKTGDEDIPASLTSEKAKADWKGLREARRKTEEENAALKKKVSELEAVATPNTTELETLRKTLADYEARLTVTNLERHPKFEEFFNGKTKTLLDQAKNIGGERIATILQLPDGEYRNTQLKEAFSELDPVGQSRIGAVINSLDELSSARKAELSRAGDVLKAMHAEKQRSVQAQQEAQAKVLDELLTRWSDPEKGHPMFQLKADDKEWNAGVEKRRKLAKDIYSGNLGDSNQLAKASGWAAAGPALAQSLQAANAKIAELSAQLDGLKAAKPGSINGGASGEDGIDDKTGFIGAVLKQYRR